MIMVLPLIILIPALLALIGVYVYRDAKRRNMNAVLWTAIVLLAPSLVGLIIYLIVREGHSDMKCPQCKEPVSEQYISCPACGARLKSVCPSCAAPVESGWKVCPLCAAPLPESSGAVIPPVRRKDKGLVRILLAIVIACALLFVSGLAALFIYDNETSGITAMSTDEYSQQPHDARIDRWIESCPKEPNKAYVLKSSKDNEFDMKGRYLVYLPQIPHNSDTVLSSSSPLGNSVSLEFSDTDNSDTDGTICIIAFTGKFVPKLKVNWGGKSLEVEITDTDFALLPSSEIIENSGTSFDDWENVSEENVYEVTE